jgi:hypothetical protein
MPRPATAVADAFLGSTRGVLGYLARLEARHSEGVLSAQDVTRAYEGAFLGYYTSLERHIERLFFGLLMGRYTVSGHSAPRITIASHRVAHEVVAGDRGYADWLPITKTERRAPIYLAGGRPFDRLNSVDKEVLQRMQWIRNAVAHRSAHATRVFRRQLIDGKGIPPRQRSPAGYLRGEHAPGQTRLEYLAAQSSQSLQKLCQ